MAGLRLLATLVLLALVVRSVDIDVVAGLLAKADVTYIAITLIVIEAQILASAWRWQFTARRLGLPLPFRRAAGEYYLTSLLNMVLPGGVAGDVVRATRLGLDAGGGPMIGRAVRSVIMERLAGQVAYTVIAVTGLLVALGAGIGLPLGATAIVAFFGFGLIALIIGVLLAARYGPQRLRYFLADLAPDARRVFTGGSAPIVQLATSFGIVASYIAVFALCGAAIGSPLPLIAMVGLVPLVLLAMLLPITVGGFGVREGAAAALWPLAGLSSEAGTATGALYGILLIVGALPGLWIVLRSRA